MTAMRAGDVVGALERFAHAHRDRFFADVKMRQAGHQRPRVELVDLRFELADRDHLPVHAQPQIDFFGSFSLGWSGSCVIFITPGRNSRHAAPARRT